MKYLLSLLFDRARLHETMVAPMSKELPKTVVVATGHENIVTDRSRFVVNDHAVARQKKWDRRFLELAAHVSTWSKDPSTKVGAVIVGAGDRRRIAHGYNGFPPGIADDERMNDRKLKYERVVHAEENAIYNATFDVTNGTMYCVWPPCIRCARAIIANRIMRVVVKKVPEVELGRWTEEIPASLEFLKEAGIRFDVIEDEV